MKKDENCYIIISFLVNIFSEIDEDSKENSVPRRLSISVPFVGRKALVVITTPPLASDLSRLPVLYIHISRRTIYRCGGWLFLVVSFGNPYKFIGIPVRSDITFSVT